MLLRSDQIAVLIKFHRYMSLYSEVEKDVEVTTITDEESCKVIGAKVLLKGRDRQGG